jgi:hypothetical protein
VFKMGIKKNSEHRFICYLALSSETTPDRAEFERKFRELFPVISATPESIADFASPRNPGSLALFSVNGTLLTAMFVGASLPFEEWDFAAKQNLVWPEARKMMEGHRAHIVIAPLNAATTFIDLKKQAQTVTAVAITMASLTPTVAAIWATGQAITKVQDFINAAPSVDKGEPAAPIWIGMLIGRGSKTDQGEVTIGAMTTGLEPFIGREIDFEPTPVPMLTVAHRLVGVMQYLLTQGPVLKDGDSIGISPTERIRAKHLAETVRLGVPVLKLTVESLDGA